MYAVTWKRAALDELADPWNNAPDRARGTAAANQIDQLLLRDPVGLGESRERLFRALFVAPLGVTYRVNRARRRSRLAGLSQAPAMKSVSNPQPTGEWCRPARHVGRRVLSYDELPSAMTTAAALGEPGVAILAGAQTAGRGQYGRSWLCPRESGVLLAVVVAPPPAARRPAVLTAWAAVGVAECIHSVTELQPRIKWPNDVLIDGKKVCGILIESAAGTSMTAVAGIGLNVIQSAADFAAAGLPDATSLAASTGQVFDTAAVAERLLDELDRVYRLLDGDLKMLEAMWANRLGLIGLPVTAELTDGTLRQGELRGLTFDAIELDGDGTVTRLSPEAVRHLNESR